MLKYEKIKIKVSYKNLNKYRLLYDINLKNGDDLEIYIKDLTKTSKTRIDFICDKCGKNKFVRFCDYNKRNKIFGDYYCNDCKGESIKKSNQEKYGVDNVFQLQSSKDKSKETCIEKYGVEHPLQNKEILEKQKETNMKLYGYEFQMQNPDNKPKETCMEKYGVQHNMHVPDFYDKMTKSGYKVHKYENSDIFYQGTYEKDFLDKYSYLGIDRGPSIKYIHNGEEHIYYSDFFNSNMNTIFEVKSSYWYEQHKDKNERKKEKCIEQGYNFIFIIDKDYTELEKLL